MIDFGNGLTDVSPWHHYCSSQPTGSSESCSPLYSHNTNKMNNAKCTSLCLKVHIVNWNICVFLWCRLSLPNNDHTTLFLTQRSNQPSNIWDANTDCRLWGSVVKIYVWSSKQCHLFSGVLVSSYYQMLLKIQHYWWHNISNTNVYIWTKSKGTAVFLSGERSLWETKKYITCKE